AAATNAPKSEVLETIEDTREVKNGKEEFTVDFQYYAKKYNLKKGEKLVVTHEVFNDEKHTDKYTEHFDLNNEKQTIRPEKVEEKPVTPAVKETPKETPKEKTMPQTSQSNKKSILPIFLASVGVIATGVIVHDVKFKKSR
ncbi:hypothetical protein IGI46_005133, partial [Enterococcus sp. AZ163]